MLNARLLPLLTVMMTAPALDAQSQSLFEAPVGPRSWSPTDWAERWKFDGPNGFLRRRENTDVPRYTTESDERRKAFDVVEIDPGILIYPDMAVDSAMVIPAPKDVDPHMILPLVLPRNINTEEGVDP